MGHSCQFSKTAGAMWGLGENREASSAHPSHNWPGRGKREELPKEKCQDMEGREGREISSQT